MFIILILVIIYIVAIAFFNYKYPLKITDWGKTDLNSMSFPSDFIWGTSTSAYQVEGGAKDSNWTFWEDQKDENGVPRVKNSVKSGLASDHWNRYSEDIQLMKDLGTNSFRLSLSWSKICPKKDFYDEAILNHYDKVINELIQNNIQPNITFHHWEEPMWFFNNGGFEKKENTKYFLDFVEKIFARYSSKVTYWSTFNEPNVYSFSGYIDGLHPPGEVDNLKKCATVLKNILDAHVKAYDLIKSMPNGENSKVGIVMHMLLFEPKNRYNLLDWTASYFYSKNFYGYLVDFFETGTFRYFAPFQVNLKYVNKNAPNKLDYIGLNYYSHVAVGVNSFDVTKYHSRVEGEIKQDYERFTIYPEGVYTSIKILSELKKPIIITENGIFDKKGDNIKDFIGRSLYSVSEAIKEGYDVRGFHYWSLMDNFEWNHAFDLKLGLYDVDLNTHERTLKEGSKEYPRIIKNYTES